MKKKILLVDDEEDIVVVIKRALENAGYEVIEAYDGDSALQKIEESSPDLVILDIMMPKLDGLSVNSKLKDNPKTAGIPVVIITGRGRMKDLKEVKAELKVTEYLEKPFTVEFLVKKVKSIIQD